MSEGVKLELMTSQARICYPQWNANARAHYSHAALCLLLATDADESGYQGEEISQLGLTVVPLQVRRHQGCHDWSSARSSGMRYGTSATWAS